MPEFGFSVIRVFPYKGRTHYILIERSTGRRKPVIWYILRGAALEHKEVLCSPIKSLGSIFGPLKNQITLK